MDIGLSSDLGFRMDMKYDPEVPSNLVDKPGVASNSIKVKKEETDNSAIDKSLPHIEEGNDMFDEVNGPEYVDLTYEGIAEVDGVSHFVCEEFKIRQIPKPVIMTRPLYQLFACIESKHIILDPEYQREVVWDEGRASLLINSILMGYFIPPIIFNCVQKIEKVDGVKKSQHKRICVDGKQRLTSVWKFMTGQIGFFDSNTPQKKWYYSHPIVNGQETASNHNILPRAVKEFFKNQIFCCYEYEELTLDTEETMFQLVQRGIALTPAEKMRAMSTAWATFTKQYEDDYALIVNLSKQNRASGFRLVLTIFTMIQEVMTGRKKRSSAPTLQASPQALLRVLDDKSAINPALKLKFKAIFDKYESLVKQSSTQITTTRYKINRNSVFDPAPEYLREAGVNHVRTFSPLELVASAILICVHMDKRNDKELLEDLKQMRLYLRVKHKDLRVNAQCWVTVWEFITDILLRDRSKEPVLQEGVSADNATTPNVQATNDVPEAALTDSANDSPMDGISTNGLSTGRIFSRRSSNASSSDLSSIDSPPSSPRTGFIIEIPARKPRRTRTRLVVSDSDETEDEAHEASTSSRSRSSATESPPPKLQSLPKNTSMISTSTRNNAKARRKPVDREDLTIRRSKSVVGLDSDKDSDVRFPNLKSGDRTGSVTRSKRAGSTPNGSRPSSKRSRHAS